MWLAPLYSLTRSACFHFLFSEHEEVNLEEM